MKQYLVTGMSCAACQARVEKAVRQVPGVTECAVSLLTNSMGVEGDASPQEIINAVEQAGYGASLRGAGRPGTGGSGSDKAGSGGSGTGGSGMADGAGGSAAREQEEALRDRETPVLKKRLAWSLGFLLLLMYLTMGHTMLRLPLPPFLTGNPLGITLTQAVLAAAVMMVNGKFFTRGFRALFAGAPNMDTLVAMGSSVSYGWSLFVFYKMTLLSAEGAAMQDLMEFVHGQLYFESAAMIPALITVGKLLEAISKGRTTDALKSLIRLSPRTATILREGKEVTLPIGEVRTGDLFLVRPGEQIPVDGTVLEGSSAVNESALTGESIPVDKAPGDGVSAGTINTSGFLKCQATRVGEDTTLAQIIRMVSDAAATKAPIAKAADRISGIFVPAVMGIAALVLVIWLLLGAGPALALERAICVLVISCPCALGLATPVAIMVGNGVGARNGILFKTGEALENAGRIGIIALDKTGTVTAGEPRVTDILCGEGVTKEELLTYAGALEKRSEHPLAKAVCEICRQEPLPVEDFQALPGNGLKATLEGEELLGGSLAFLERNLEIPEEMRTAAGRFSEEGKTPLLFAKKDRVLGILAVMDVLRETSRGAIEDLKNLGIEVLMLTGDNERTAKAVGALAGVSGVIAGVLPEGKAQVIRDLQKRGKVAMVGDGINDAPALATADLGIAIGAGTDVAMENADIVLAKSSLEDLTAAVRIGRATLRNIHENLFWAFFYNLICIPLAAGAFGLRMNPMLGAAAMSLSSFTVCMNALRLNLVKPYGVPKRGKGQDTDPAQGAEHGKNKTQEENKMTKTVEIQGMMCEHCEATVKKALEALAGVEEAKVSHKEGTAVLTLSGEVSEETIRKAVEDRDYTFVGIRA